MPIFPLNSPGVKYSVYIRALIMVGLNFSGYGKISHLYFRSQILLLFFASVLDIYRTYAKYS